MDALHHFWIIPRPDYSHVVVCFSKLVSLFRILVWFIWNLAKPTLSSLFFEIRKFLGSPCCVVGIFSIRENSCLILVPRLFQKKNMGNINLCTFAYLLTKYPIWWMETNPWSIKKFSLSDTVYKMFSSCPANTTVGFQDTETIAKLSLSHRDLYTVSRLH